MSQGKDLNGGGAQLSDFLAVSLLARVYPRAVVDQILTLEGVNSKRVRAFPALAGVYYCMGLSLYPEQSYEAVFTAISQGLAWGSTSGHSGSGVVKSAISKVRTKLGSAPLERLARQCCVPLAHIQRHPHAFFAGRRVVAIDGSTLELADERANVAAFGYPGSRTGQTAYPHARCAVLVECATHAVLSANIGPYNTSEWQVCQPLLKCLDPSMLCLADRGFNGFAAWQAARATGAQLLWRVAKDRQLPMIKRLGDGSYLSKIVPSKRKPIEPNNTKAFSQPSRDPTQAITVRVIEYELPNHAERYRLVTSLLDEIEAPGEQLAALYHQRWQVEAVFDELKTHLVNGRRVLRSKTPQLVRQEFYGWVLAHFAVRWLMHEAADHARLRQDELSFTAHVNLLKQSLPLSGAFPPRAKRKAPALVA